MNEEPSEEQAKKYLAILRNTTEEEIDREYGTVYFDGFGGICRKGESEEELIVELNSDEVTELYEMGINPHFFMGRKMRCPNCRKVYTPDLERKHPELKIQDEHPNATPEQREQHISGICSSKCWSEFLGVKE